MKTLIKITTALSFILGALPIEANSSQAIRSLETLTIKPEYVNQLSAEVAKNKQAYIAAARTWDQLRREGTEKDAIAKAREELTLKKQELDSAYEALHYPGKHWKKLTTDYDEKRLAAKREKQNLETEHSDALQGVQIAENNLKRFEDDGQQEIAHRRLGTLLSLFHALEPRWPTSFSTNDLAEFTSLGDNSNMRLICLNFFARYMELGENDMLKQDLDHIFEIDGTKGLNSVVAAYKKKIGDYQKVLGKDYTPWTKLIDEERGILKYKNYGRNPHQQEKYNQNLLERNEMPEIQLGARMLYALLLNKSEAYSTRKRKIGELNWTGGAKDAVNDPTRREKPHAPADSTVLEKELEERGFIIREDISDVFNQTCEWIAKKARETDNPHVGMYRKFKRDVDELTKTSDITYYEAKVVEAKDKVAKLDAKLHDNVLEEIAAEAKAKLDAYRTTIN